MACHCSRKVQSARATRSTSVSLTTTTPRVPFAPPSPATYPVSTPYRVEPQHTSHHPLTTMSTTLLNEKDVRALKRADIQKLAKREGIRANGKTDAMVVALFAMYPGGILPLEKEKVPVRRSRRRGTPEPKVEEVEEELGGEPPVYGESISQYVPPRRREAVRPAVVAADEQEAQQQQRAPSPLPTPPPPPSPPQHEEEDLPPTLPNTPVPSPVTATSRGMFTHLCPWYVTHHGRHRRARPAQPSGSPPPSSACVRPRVLQTRE
ncbi:uncharacterized protein C8Q71DRAFT_786735 [Rhodofomes roseus]|uniref:Rho termination factor N-terminal domain-containing protein n=1 Tax=Rhodofomes roseus TaxID=34475 RepID=A0ABQ8K0T6_9APHY|nr:uncharacterized protein C8Q71DRAFT_786735 [Rhodofomes roseus]KAH9830300.1 hypothetical protein C8Q71DRAFT_786735 [Rhodofomes roseus]